MVTIQCSEIQSLSALGQLNINIDVLSGVKRFRIKRFRILFQRSNVQKHTGSVN